jgi:hypothetical protein
VALSIQRDTGGNLAETLANLSALLRARQQLRLKIRAFTSEARATMMIMAGLPFLVGGILFLISPKYIGPLFTTPTGQMVAAAAACSMGSDLHQEQDRDHQGLSIGIRSPSLREKNSRLLIALAAFVAFWAVCGRRSPGQPQIEARLRALQTRRMKTSSEQIAGKALDEGGVDRRHATDCRSPQPAARQRRRPDDAASSGWSRLHAARRPRSSCLSSSSPCPSCSAS